MRVAAAAAALFLAGGAAAATITGTRGADRIVGWGNGMQDSIRCGPGRDVVNADARDAVARDCETLLRVVAADRTGRTGAQHGTVVEPDSSAWGNTVVAVAQSGRYTNGAAAGTVYTTSLDAGRTWRSGLLPRLDRFERVSDPAVAYDAGHGVWLAATLGISPGREGGLLVHRSVDGLSWEPPVVVDSTPGRLAFDKEWIACDTWPTSPFRGRCYLAYTHFTFAPDQSAIAVRYSDDGGRTWSAPALTAVGGEGKLGAFPVVRPAGDLLVLFRLQGAVVVSRSTDGGVTLSPPAAIARLTAAPVAGVRAPAIPNADVTSTGRVLTVWPDCSRRPSCDGNDVAVASSDDGVTWSTPESVPLARLGSAFLPALAVDPGSDRVGIVTYTAAGCPLACRIDAWLLESANGRGFSSPRRLSARSMELGWIARSSGGAMLADYISLSYAGGRAVPLVVLALPPRGQALRQALLAPSRLDG